MTNIIQLPPEVANQISAGEVVERPASVVKELVENSIDAGSSKILIEVENGGRDRIRVKDNGCGIIAEEMELAFSRYATSKIKNINDLYSIKTLGFRGEALASISSVSHLEISSRSNQDLKGRYLKLTDNKVLNEKPIGIPVGTDIVVKDLFYNTPARYKYLKTTNTEFGQISSVVNKEALAYPQIQFTLSHDGKQVLQTPGTGKLADTIFAIYGQGLVEQLLSLEFEDRYIHLSGYIARADYYRSSRIYQLFFVNQRCVNNPVLNRGTEAGYRGLLPPGRFPVVFINLKLNQILVDVNVHPTKREVKFSRDEIIKDVMTKGIRSTLSTTDNSPRLVPKSTTRTVPVKENLQQGKLIFNQPERIKEKGLARETYLSPPPENIPAQEEIKNEKPVGERNDYKKIEQAEAKTTPSVQKILGQIMNNTYIIAEATDGLYIIDQHNAHEQILYESYYHKYKNKRVISQPLLIPITIELTLPEKELINKYRAELNQLGIKLENFGGSSIIIQEVPVIMKKRPSKQVIEELLDNLLEQGKTLNQAEIIKEMITFMSCRSAIKAGKELEQQEIRKLVDDLFKSANPFRCPHGRPIIVHLTGDDINKGLGR